MKEGIKRNDEKTSLFFALVCRRANRKNACLKWTQRYLENQDEEDLDSEMKRQRISTTEEIRHDRDEFYIVSKEETEKQIIRIYTNSFIHELLDFILIVYRVHKYLQSVSICDF